MMTWLWQLVFPVPADGQTRGQRLAQDLAGALLGLVLAAVLIVAFAAILVGMHPS